MMQLSRRSLLAYTLAIPGLPDRFAFLAGRERPDEASSGQYFPPSDANGGWRAIKDASEVRTRTGIDRSRLDAAFKYCKTTSRHGGLLVLRHGHLVYEQYFGRGNRHAKPDAHSIAKMFTSVCCGMMLDEHRDRFPDGLATKVVTQELLPEAFPLIDSRVAEIRLGNLLTMTSGIQTAEFIPQSSPKPTWHKTAIVGGENVSLPAIASSDPEDNPVSNQDRSALRGRMWTAPGQGYLYGRDPHIASIILRHVVGKELEDLIRERIATPLEWGAFGYDRHSPSGTLPHTPGESGIAVHATDLLRFGYLLLNNGRWRDKQVVPSSYVELCRKPSPFNPHCPFSLQFEVNADGHVAGAPLDTYFKSGAGGYGLYIVPSLDLVIYKMSSLPKDDSYDPCGSGLPVEYTPDTSRDSWEPHPFNQFLDGPVEGDAGVRRLLEMVVAAVVDEHS